MEDDEVRAVADKVWKSIQSAHHGGDGFQDAYNSMLLAMRELADSGASQI